MSEPIPMIKISTPSVFGSERTLPPVSPALSHLRHPEYVDSDNDQPRDVF